MEKDLGKTSTGIQANVSALLSYSLGFVSGLIFFLIEKENKFVRFHALQSMIAFGALYVVQQIFIYMSMPPIIIQLIGIGILILWIVLMIKSYQGEMIKLPVAGDIAQQKTQ